VNDTPDRALSWIYAHACEAGGPGFKSQRAH